MAKRFTDTEKWEDPWFRNLLPEYQRFWIYVLDKCDPAGVWKVDFEMAEFCLKQSLNPDELLKVFHDRVKVFERGERWFIPKFISFQYNKLDERCNPHKSVFKLLSSYKLEGYLEGYSGGIYTSKNKTRQDKDKTITRQDNMVARNGHKRVPLKSCHICDKSFPADKVLIHSVKCGKEFDKAKR